VTWQQQAACRGRTTDMFPPSLFEPLAVARYCQSCPVRVDCQAAGVGEPAGVWGGLTAAERQRVAVKRKRRAA
jgi:WhiB family transcriptional regulator, redox-sensing transcriptional regulator